MRPFSSGSNRGAVQRLAGKAPSSNNAPPLPSFAPGRRASFIDNPRPAPTPMTKRFRTAPVPIAASVYHLRRARVVYLARRRPAFPDRKTSLPSGHRTLPEDVTVTATSSQLSLNFSMTRWASSSSLYPPNIRQTPKWPTPANVAAKTFAAVREASRGPTLKSDPPL